MNSADDNKKQRPDDECRPNPTPKTVAPAGASPGVSPSGQLEPILESALSRLIEDDGPLRKLILAECRAASQATGVEVRTGTINALISVVEKAAAEQVARHLPSPQVIEVCGSRRRPKRINQPFHASFPKILKMATARTQDGFPVPLWLHGPKGVGKSKMARQMATGLGVPFYLVAMSPSTAEGKLLGYTNLVSGDFVRGLLFEPFANGGLAFIDEIDIADPGVLVGINSLVTDCNFRFPNGEIITRHPDFYLLAGGNTDGTGATDGYIRRKMD